jgi:hypothetical protein
VLPGALVSYLSFQSTVAGQIRDVRNIRYKQALVHILNKHHLHDQGINIGVTLSVRAESSRKQLVYLQRDQKTLKRRMTHKTNLNKTINSVACVRERTIPTERPPLVGEVSANFCG